MVDHREKTYGIGQFAKLTGVTERTLRYYDRQGLLTPSARNEHGHRFYREQDLFQLQKIITLKYLNFSLEEIAEYLRKPEVNIQETLLTQYELLKQKQDQINQVLSALDRMRQLAEGAETVDPDLLLMYIHNVLNEPLQKEWLSKEMPSSLLHDLFMEGIPPEEKLQFQRRISVMMTQIKECYKQGLAADKPEVQKFGWDLVAVIEEILGPMTSRISEEELKKWEQLDQTTAMTLFPTGFSKEEEHYFYEVFEKMNVVAGWMGGADHAETSAE